MRGEDARVRVRPPTAFVSWLFVPPDLEQKHAKSRRETGFRSYSHFAALCGLLFKTVWAASGSAAMSVRANLQTSRP